MWLLPPEGRRFMGIFKRKPKENKALIQCSPRDNSTHPFSLISSYKPLSNVELDLYSSLREALPIVDAAIGKLDRLLGSFTIECKNESTTLLVKDFLENVNVCNGNKGIGAFISSYFQQLLTYGEAVGEIVLSNGSKDIVALYNANLKDITLAPKGSPADIVVCSNNALGTQELPYQNLLMATMLNPEPGRCKGNSILKGLPFVTEILLKIYSSIGQNFDRVGNIRFAVTYKPDSNSGSTMYTRENAEQIAGEWSRVMRDSHTTHDFVSVGDVSIKTIGADNQVLECDVPIRRITEQIIAKLSVPPFLLGLSWSTTERMSSQQADILTSELEHYRELLNPVIIKIVKMFLNLRGIDEKITVRWNNINLQDELEMSNARLNRANALRTEMEVKRDFGVVEGENGEITEVKH